MYPVDEKTLDLFRKNYRQVARLTIAGKYQTLVIDESEIIQGGLILDRYCVSGEKVELGSAIASELTVKLKNYDGKYDDVVFEGAEVFVEIGIKKWDAHRWEKAEIVYIPSGYYIVDTPPRALSTITLSALDRMVRFDKDVDWSLFSFPMTVSELIYNVCGNCGVALATDRESLVNSNYVITAQPTGYGTLTYRNLIQWCAFLTGTCAYIDYNGQLRLEWYTSTDIAITPSERYSSDMYENDITITGIVYTASDGSTYVTGETDYTLTFTGCGILQNNVEFALANIYYSIRGFSYRPYEATIKPAPYIYPLDMIEYTDSKGVVHNTIVTHATFTMNNSTVIAGTGITSTSDNYSTSNGLTDEQSQAMQEMKNSIEVTITSQELEGLNVAQILANAMGYNFTILTDSDEEQTKHYYVHNNSTLALSDSIYTLRSGLIAWTDNWNGGNPKWTTTITKNNNIILQVLADYQLGTANIEDDAITEAKLDDDYVNKVDIAIGTAEQNAKSYSDNNLQTAKTYADNVGTAAKTYSDSNLDTAKGYTDKEVSGAKSYADGLSNAIMKVLEDYMVRSDIEALARYLFITGSDGVEYKGKIKVVNGKPVFEYDTTEGGNE